MADGDTEMIDAVRRFTRFYTRQIDLLNEHLLASRFSLAEARVLYEIGHRDGLTASDLVRELGIDPGYLSRILKRLAGAGLLARSPSGLDARQSVLRPTETGRSEIRSLDRGSDEQVAGMLAALPERDRRRLVEAMATVERLLGAGRDRSPEVVLRPHRIGDIGWIARRQGMLYAEEYGWDATFEALVSEIAAGFVRSFDPARERAWIAEVDGAIAGSVFLVRQSDEVAKLRLLYVEPDARGLGIGRRLVESCIGFARETRYRTLTLWTNDILASARRIYEAEGFRLVEEERHHSFGVDLVGQNWELAL